MKDYKVCIKTTFIKWHKIQANSKEEAKEKAEKIIENGVAIDTEDFNSEVVEVL